MARAKKKPAAAVKKKPKAAAIKKPKAAAIKKPKAAAMKKSKPAVKTKPAAAPKGKKPATAGRTARAAVAAAKPAPGKPGKTRTPQPSVAVATDGWVDAGKGYAVTLEEDTLVARNPKGQRLGSVPKEVKASDAAEQLVVLRDWLAQHARECAATVETWMLRSLPVPRATLEQVWDDPAWRRPLENAVVFAAPGGVPDYQRGGFFRGVDPKRGVGVVDVDGETTWLLDADQIVIPHPILIPELDAWRELATQLAIAQGVAQLLRETHAPTTDLSPGQTGVNTYAEAKFAMLIHALGKAKSLGYRVRGGYAVCAVWEAGKVTEARYWIGADSPDSETYTGDLAWVDGREHAIKVAEVGPVAYSEGVRMASAIHAARVVEKEAS